MLQEDNARHSYDFEIYQKDDAAEIHIECDRMNIAEGFCINNSGDAWELFEYVGHQIIGILNSIRADESMDFMLNKSIVKHEAILDKLGDMYCNSY